MKKVLIFDWFSCKNKDLRNKYIKFNVAFCQIVNKVLFKKGGIYGMGVMILGMKACAWARVQGREGRVLRCSDGLNSLNCLY